MKWLSLSHLRLSFIDLLIILDKEKAIATLQMFLSCAEKCIETQEEAAIAISFMIIFYRFAHYFR